MWILLTRSSIINTLKHPKCRRLFLLTPFIHTVLQNWQSFLYNPLFPCDFPLEFSCQTTFWILLFVKHFVPFSELLNECNNFLSPSIAELKKRNSAVDESRWFDFSLDVVHLDETFSLQSSRDFFSRSGFWVDIIRLFSNYYYLY